MNGLNVIVWRILLIAFVIIGANSSAFAQRPAEKPPTTPKPPETDSTTQTDETPDKGWSYDPDAGFVYRKFDFKLAATGYGERLFNPDGQDSWRRVRQSLAIEFPRFTKKWVNSHNRILLANSKAVIYHSLKTKKENDFLCHCDLNRYPSFLKKLFVSPAPLFRKATYI